MASAGTGSFQILKAKELSSPVSPATPSKQTTFQTRSTSAFSNPPTARSNRQKDLPSPDQTARSRQRKGTNSPNRKGKNQNIIWIDGQTIGPSDQNVPNDPFTRAAEFNPSATMTVAHTRRNANGTVGSVFSGNKIRHLKKEDGIPLWRKDIQLEFLRCVFEDDTRCFTMPWEQTKGHTFSEVYIDTMARSSKTSKVLKEKLLADRTSAMSMAMICLLVNVGRMNTTLNFFPEMRAQLRTFHAIPSLQANQDPNAYKQLQDAPRLKSILKGASEDMNQPNTIEKIKAAPVPRTNPVHLIFVLSQYAPKISEMHFQPPRDFFDLVMRGTLSSKSRARAFLWLIWWYLESNFTKEDALNNPFGSGAEGEGTDGLPIKVPPFEHLTEAQADAENVDTEAEKQYGELKRVERRKILEEDESVGPPMKKQKRGQDEAVIAISDTDPTRTPSPSSAVQSRPHLNPTAHSFASSNNVNENGYSHPRYHNIASKTDPSNPQKLVLKTRMDNPVSSSPPLPHNSGHAILSAVSNGHRRPRPETSHQRAVNMNRKMRIDHILHKHLTSHQAAMRRDQRRNRSSFGMMVMNRVKDLPENYDSDDDTSWGPGGLVPNRNEPEDYGAEAIRYKKVLDRALRRLARAEDDDLTTGRTKGYRRRRKRSMEHEDMQEGFDRYEARKGGNDRASGQKTKLRGGQADEDQLDDLDLDLLGENMEDEDDSGSNGEGDDAELTEEDAGMQY